MKNLILLGAFAALSGCVMPTDDLLNNRYMEHVPEAPPAGMAGDWTGTMGPYLLTLRIDQDGTGRMCSSYLQNNSVNALKYAGGTLYYQDGTRTAANYSSDTLTILAPYFNSQPSRLVRDTGLKQAAPYCQQNL